MEIRDPYHAPESRVAAELPEERLAIEAAGRWRRFFNWAIDYAVLKVFWTTVGVLYLVWCVSRGEDPMEAALRYRQTPTGWVYVYALSTIMAYYVVMEGLFGFTVGKLVTGTRVVNAQGGRPTFGQAFGRTLCRLIPFEPFSLFFSKDGEVRGWHDSVPKTWVVRRRR